MDNNTFSQILNKGIETYSILGNSFDIYYVDGSKKTYYTDNVFRDEQIIKDKMLEQDIYQLHVTKNRKLKKDLKKYKMYLTIKKAIYDNKTAENDLLKTIDFEPIYLPPLVSDNINCYSYRKIKKMFKIVKNK